MARKQNLIPQHSIFLCYRRDDARYAADIVEGKLREHFGDAAVFQDLNRIPGGADVGASIKRALAACRVGVVLIGPDWLTLASADGKRRIDNQTDFVRLEISALLSVAQRRVIPVYVEGAVQLRADQLPRRIAALARLNGRWVRHGSDLSSDLARIIDDVGAAAESWTESPQPEPTFNVKPSAVKVRGAAATESALLKKAAVPSEVQFTTKVVFIHGLGVTYDGLPAALAENAPSSLNLQVMHLYLGKYVSFADEVKVDDIARGMQHALAAEILPKLATGERFACITHSTIALVVRKWIDVCHGAELKNCPLSHLVMLAPANHGSALAQLNKARCLAGAVTFGPQNWHPRQRKCR